MKKERLVELEEALKPINWDVIGLSEVRREGEEIVELPNMIFHYFGETKGKYGVGFCINKNLKNNIIKIKGISERIAVLTLKTTEKEQLDIIQCYAPTEEAKEEEKKSFYDELNNCIVKETSNKNIVIMGDFNARIGKRKEHEEYNIGLFSTNTRNTNGEKLIEFAQENNLRVLNTFFKKRPHRKWTWISPDSKTKAEIDFFLSKNVERCTDVDVINNFNFFSDHRVIRCQLLLNFKRNRKAMHPDHKSICYTSETHNELFNENLKSITEKLKCCHNTQEKYNTVTAEIKLAAQKLPNIKNTKLCLTQETLDKIEERSTISKQINRNKDQNNYLKELNKTTKRLIRRDIRKYENMCISHFLEKSCSIVKLERHLKTERNWIPNVKPIDKSKVYKRKNIVQVATEFYSKLYSNEIIQPNIEIPTIINSDALPDITVFEIENAINSLQNGKSSGTDKINAELLKIGKNSLLQPLADIFNEILHNQEIPEQWLISTIILLLKKGNADDINNYRPISILSTIYKVFSKIILIRITQCLDEQQPPEQAGFRRGYSTTDHLHTMQQLIEKTNEYKLPLFIAFIDFQKAFDSINHQYVWQALLKDGVDMRYINTIKKIYELSSARIKLDQLGSAFSIDNGVKQGDCMSPKLFNSVLEHVFRTLNWESMGVNINGKYLSNIRFADDIALFGNTEKELQQMIKELNIKCKEVGLQLNISKTKVMTNTSEPIHISVENLELQQVETFIYLGKTVSFKNQDNEEITRRINNGWKRFWSLKHIFKNKQILMKLKAKVFDSCILPVLTYGAQTWALTKNNIKRLKITQRKMERSILNKKLIEKTHNTELRKLTKVTDVIRHAKKLKWKWAGHIMRQTDGRWTKELTEWCPRYSTRGVGRPATRWRDELAGFTGAGECWTRCTANKLTWKKMGEAFAQQWDDL